MSELRWKKRNNKLWRKRNPYIIGKKKKSYGGLQLICGNNGPLYAYHFGTHCISHLD